MDHRDYGPGVHVAHKMLRDGGYAGGDVKVKSVAKKVVKKALHQHENAEHGGKHEKLKLKGGGAVHGNKSASRPDRRARGGSTGMKPKVGAVNIHIGKDGEGDGGQANPMQQQMAAKEGLQKGIQIGAQMGARQMAAKMMGGAPGGPAGPVAPGGPPPGAGMPPPGGMPPQGRPMLKVGGPVPMKASAANGEGRLEKTAKIKVKAHERRRSGGKVEC